MWDENDLRHTAKRDFRRLAITLILQEIVLLGSAYIPQLHGFPTICRQKALRYNSF